MPFDIKYIAQKYADNLTETANKLRNISDFEPSSWVIGFSTLDASDDELKSRLDMIFGNGAGIYWFGAPRVPMDHILNEFKNNKKPDYNYSKINSRNNIKNTIYVGGTQNLKKRLAEHMIYVSKETYALHLRTWATSIEGTIYINALKCPNMDAQTMQALEDAVWDELQPAFGKRGPR